MHNEPKYNLGEFLAALKNSPDKIIVEDSAAERAQSLGLFSKEDIINYLLSKQIQQFQFVNSIPYRNGFGKKKMMHPLVDAYTINGLYPEPYVAFFLIKTDCDSWVIKSMHANNTDVSTPFAGLLSKVEI